MENILSSDIFLATKFIEKLKSKYINIPEDTLLLGIYGYLSVIFSNLIQNTATMVSDYSMEAIPTRAKFEKNIIAHALSFGINKINAVPASMDVFLAFPKDSFNTLLKDDTLILDSDFVFSVGDRQLYPYMLDYDIKIKHSKMPNGKEVYTAMYITDNDHTFRNPLSIKNNPYLPTVGIINATGQDMIILQTTLRQMEHKVVNYKIIVDNPVETKVIDFTFENQLAFFYVEAIEDTDTGYVTHYLEPVYEGLSYAKFRDEYINYMILDDKTIRLKFNRNSYQPMKNTEVNIHIYTTLGEECNLYIDDPFQLTREMLSSKYGYTGLHVLVRNMSSSLYAENKASAEELQKLIPKEVMSRGSYSTYSDLQIFFNLLQTKECKLTSFQRIYNQLENIYFVYLLMKYNDTVVPTNNIEVIANRGDFVTSSRNNFILNPKSTFFLEKGSEVATVVSSDLTYDEIENYESRGFLYTCPFLMVVNKNPFYVSFYNVFVKYNRLLYFYYINENSDLQFIVNNFKVYRNAFDTPSNELHIEVECMQNINTNYNILVFDNENKIVQSNIRCFAVFYTFDKDDIKHPIRYCEGTVSGYNTTTLAYTFDFTLITNNIMNSVKPHMLFEGGLKSIFVGEESAVYLDKNVEMKIFIYIKTEVDKGRTYTADNNTDELSADDLIPNMQGWTLTNIYTTSDTGIDLFYDYSDLVNSYIKMVKTDDDIQYKIFKIPVLKKSWWNTEDKVTYFLQMLDYRRRYIQEAMSLIENPFGINFKFYNTYGYSKNFNIDKEENIDRVNISLKFEVMFVNKEDQALIPEIRNTIKSYIENINEQDDIHMPNLITHITNIYRNSIVYIKFIKLNEYDYLWQSIYKNPKVVESAWIESQNTPEFLNINELPNGLPDITFDIM